MPKNYNYRAEYLGYRAEFLARVNGVLGVRTVTATQIKVAAAWDC